MDADLFELEPTERAQYFAPTAICGYLTVLCSAVAVTSMFVVTLPGAVAVTAVGVFGTLTSAGLGLLLYRAQQRDRCYVTLATGGDDGANFDAVRRAVLAAGWRLSREEPARRLEAHTIGALRLAGERVAVRFEGGVVRVASICDPGVGFSLAGRRRCEQHRELLRRAIGDAHTR